MGIDSNTHQPCTAHPSAEMRQPSHLIHSFVCEINAFQSNRFLSFVPWVTIISIITITFLSLSHSLNLLSFDRCYTRTHLWALRTHLYRKRSRLRAQICRFVIHKSTQPKWIERKGKVSPILSLWTVTIHRFLLGFILSDQTDLDLILSFSTTINSDQRRCIHGQPQTALPEG